MHRPPPLLPGLSGRAPTKAPARDPAQGAAAGRSGRELLGAPVFAADRSAGPGPVLRAAPVQPRTEGEVHERGDGDLLPPAGGGLPPGPPVPPSVPGDGWPEGGGSDRVRLQGHLLAVQLIIRSGVRSV